VAILLKFKMEGL